MLSEIQIKLAKLSGVEEEVRGQEISERIHQKYPLSAQLAVQRQREQKPEEFAEYNAYCEAVKAQVKAQFAAVEVPTLEGI